MANHAYCRCNHIFINVLACFIYCLVCGRHRFVYQCEWCKNFKTLSQVIVQQAAEYTVDIQYLWFEQNGRPQILTQPFWLYTHERTQICLFHMDTLMLLFVFSHWTYVKCLFSQYSILLLVCILSSKSFRSTSDHLFSLTGFVLYCRGV